MTETSGAEPGPGSGRGTALVRSAARAASLGRGLLGHPAETPAEDRDEENRRDPLQSEDQEAGGEDQAARVGEHVVAGPLDRQLYQLGERAEHQHEPEEADAEAEAQP